MPRFLDFNHLALILHEAKLTPDTRRVVAEKMSEVLASRYPAFSRPKFYQAAMTGKPAPRATRAVVTAMRRGLPKPFLSRVA